MTWDEYCIEANKTWNPALTGSDALEYIRLKLIEEFSEVLGEYTKERFHGKKPDYIGELGDVMWYIAALVNSDIVHFDVFMNKRYRVGMHPSSADSCIEVLLLWNLKSHETDYMVKSLLSDVMNMIESTGLTNEQVWAHNIAKLRKRHGSSYNTAYYENKKELV